MKRILTSGFLAAMALLMVQAQPPRFKFKKNPEERYTLKVGKATMEIDAANGARVMSLKYDTTEVISQLNIPNQYGSTFWTSPQKEWNWPPIFELDMAPYEAEKQADGSIVMRGPVAQKLPFRVTKRFAVDAKNQSFVLTYSITNEGQEARKVAPWEITRVPQEGTIYCDAKAEEITGSNGMPRLNFVQNAAGWAQYDIDHPKENRKVNADGKGWLAYENKGIILTKRFQDLKEGEAAPDEAEIQVYVDQGGKVVEIESQGAYTLLQPGESLDYTVTWHVAPAQEVTIGQVTR
ncbi:MAG: DUF4380 domain-containing protein [Bacteroidales bacterium]|nr:DUF4380 domain-containing protein [Bacteroidales bacterium]